MKISFSSRQPNCKSQVAARASGPKNDCHPSINIRLNRNKCLLDCQMTNSMYRYATLPVFKNSRKMITQALWLIVERRIGVKKAERICVYKVIGRSDAFWASFRYFSYSSCAIGRSSSGRFGSSSNTLSLCCLSLIFAQKVSPL